MRARLLLQLTVLAALTSCATTAPSTARSSFNRESALVLRGQDLGAGSLLESMRGRVLGMAIGNASDGCPIIHLRGTRSIMAPTNPTVYVDGTRMLDTCVLRQISVADVDYIEVYPGGAVAPRGVPASPTGIIRVFRHRA